VLADAPALVLEASNSRCFLELELGKALFDFCTRVKDREMFPDHFVRGVALEAVCAGVPAQDVAIRVEREDGVFVDALDEQAMELAGLVGDATGRLLVRRGGGVEWAVIGACSHVGGGGSPPGRISHYRARSEYRFGVCSLSQALGWRLQPEPGRQAGFHPHGT